jgi:hypothetical protein
MQDHGRQNVLICVEHQQFGGDASHRIRSKRQVFETALVRGVCDASGARTASDGKVGILNAIFNNGETCGRGSTVKAKNNI